MLILFVWKSERPGVDMTFLLEPAFGAAKIRSMSNSHGSMIFDLTYCCTCFNSLQSLMDWHLAKASGQQTLCHPCRTMQKDLQRVSCGIERVVTTTKNMLQRQRTSLHRQVSVKTIPTR